MGIIERAKILRERKMILKQRRYIAFDLKLLKKDLIEGKFKCIV